MELGVCLWWLLEVSKHGMVYQLLMVNETKGIRIQDTAAYKLRNPIYIKRGYYADKAVISEFILKVLETLKISRFTLGRMVKPENPDHIYLWINGNRRPSARTHMRISQLIMQKMEGTFNPKHIPDWEDDLED